MSTQTELTDVKASPDLIWLTTQAAFRSGLCDRLFGPTDSIGRRRGHQGSGQIPRGAEVQVNTTARRGMPFQFSSHGYRYCCRLTRTSRWRRTVRGLHGGSSRPGQHDDTLCPVHRMSTSSRMLSAANRNFTSAVIRRPERQARCSLNLPGHQWSCRWGPAAASLRRESSRQRVSRR